MTNHITHIVKRSGKLVLFDEHKIISAVFKAMQAAEEGAKEDAERVMHLVVKNLNDAFTDKQPTVEDVQDHVEQALMEAQFAKTAKAFILYRAERTRLREEKAQLTGGIVDDLDLSINALRVMEQRYLLRDKEGQIIETPSELFWRVANKVASVEQKYGEEPKSAARVFYKMMTALEFLPCSPTLMNAGTPRQLASCFVFPIDDSVESIFETLTNAAIIQKNGGGTGFSFSRIRPKHDTVAGVERVTGGPLAFMRIYEAGMKAVRQSGRRQGANMGVLRVDHPDILEFISLKLDGQTLSNFNISVALTDSFMEALENDTEYDLLNPRNGAVAGRVNARVVFDSMLASSWRVGDPGVLFIDRINKDNVCSHVAAIEATGPCGEQPLMPYESCIEGSINLVSCIRYRKTAAGRKSEFDWEKLRKLVREAVRFLDDAIDANNYFLADVEKMAKGTRKIGLGVMGVADLFYALYLPYDSDDALRLAEEIARTIMDEADKASVELGRQRGVFGFYKGSALERQGHKRRNSALLGIAPTGTISMIADVSGGVEPNYALAYTRTVTGGRDLLVVNRHFEEAAKEQGIDEEIVKRIVQRGVIADDEVPEEFRRVFVTSQQIPPDAHIKMQAAFQRHIDGAISKTINFPSSASIKEIGDGILNAWKLGCKGLTVYRDGSLSVQVLNVGS